MQKQKILSLILMISLFSLLGSQIKINQTQAYKLGDIIITEFVPNPQSGQFFLEGEEWVKIYNTTDEDIDLTGWQIDDEVEGSSSKNFPSDTILKGNSEILIPQNAINVGLNNGGDDVRMIDPDGQEINKVTYGTASKSRICLSSESTPCNYLDPKDFLPNSPPSTGEYIDQGDVDSDNGLFVQESIYFDLTLTFVGENQDLTYYWNFENNGLYYITEDPNINYTWIEPGAYDVKVLAFDEDYNYSEFTFTNLNITKKANVTEGIVINEFVADPLPGEAEWVELYNFSTEIINLTDWTLSEGGGGSINLSGDLDPNEFIVYDLSSLNNSGDLITLKNSDNFIVDQVSYGDWDDGNTANNAPMTNDPNSVARTSDGGDSNVDNIDFAVTTTPTPKQKNLITAPYEEEEETESTSYQYSTQIFINEVMPNPEGSDDQEWIELYNAGSEDINLNGWQLDDAMNSGSSPFKFDESFIIPAHSYLIISKKTSKISLNNSGESVYLLDPAEQIISQLSYDKAEENATFARKENGTYDWTAEPTKGKQNVFKAILNEKNSSKSSSNSGSNIGTSLKKLTNSKLLSFSKIKISPNLSSIIQNLQTPLSCWQALKKSSILLKILISSEIIGLAYLVWIATKKLLNKKI